MCARAADHTKLKNTKFYSEWFLVNHTKICTNENFLLYGSTCIYVCTGCWDVYDEKVSISVCLCSLMVPFCLSLDSSLLYNIRYRHNKAACDFLVSLK